MRTTVLSRHHVACFVALLLVAAWDGAGAAHETQQVSSDTHCDQPLPAVLAPDALPTSVTVAPDLENQTAPAGVAADVTASRPGGLPSLEVEWRTTRRPFTEIVSYRTTGPPSRIS